MGKDRREFLEELLKTGLVIGATGLSRASLGNISQKNILFISIDDLNDWGGPFQSSYQKVFTPGLDKLASMGTTFSKAYCAAPACGPSRTSLMSGLHPKQFSDDGWKNFREYVGNNKVLPEIFKENGYNVYGCGKLFHGQHDYNQENVPWRDINYESKLWTEYMAFPGDPTIYEKIKDERFIYGAHYPNEEDMPDRKILKWAKSILARKQEKPFFLGVGFYRPHLPWLVPKKYFDMYPLEGIQVPNVPAHDLSDVPPIGVNMATGGAQDHKRITGRNEWKNAIQGYLASITFADNCLLELLGALEASGYQDNTLIVLWSDHGWHLGEKLGWRKFKMWERATKVPLMFAGPGIQRNVTCETVVSLMDVLPTLTDMALGKTFFSERGSSLKNVLANPRRIEERYALTSTGPSNQRHYTVRSSRWRYIQYSDGSQELYDHINDPNEWFNLLNKESSRSKLLDVVQNLKRFM